MLPVVGKIIESILRNRIQPKIEETQSPSQSGFMTSPLNSALILEEIVKECKDSGESVHFIFFDAKSAFDVVDHKHLMRRLYHIGVQDKHWSLISSMHQQATNVVK